MRYRGETIISASRRLYFYAEHGLVLLLGVIGLLLHISALHKLATPIWPLAVFLPLIGIGLVRIAIHWGRKMKTNAVTVRRGAWTTAVGMGQVNGASKLDDEGSR